jgi:hypothetical protein
MNCLKCKKTIAPVQNLEPGLSSAGKDNPQLHTLGNDRFFICPHCGAKNCVVMSADHGVSALKISHLLPYVHNERVAPMSPEAKG